MGTRGFFHDDAVEYREGFAGSDRDRRQLDQLIEQDRKRLAQIMADQYSDTDQRVKDELDFTMRVCAEGDGRVEEILADLRDGTITAREAATQLSAAKRDLNKVRKLTADLPAAEERAWEQVNTTPGDFQRQVAKRFPALFQGGRGLLELPTDD